MCREGLNFNFDRVKKFKIIIMIIIIIIIIITIIIIIVVYYYYYYYFYYYYYYYFNKNYFHYELGNHGLFKPRCTSLHKHLLISPPRTSFLCV